MANEMMHPKQTVRVGGEVWQLHKAATDGTVSFPYERIKVDNFACEKIADGAFIILVGGILIPTRGTIEKPLKIMFVGFSNVEIAPQLVGVQQLRNMHIYKTDMSNFAQEFAKDFFATESSAAAMAEITPFPKREEKSEVKIKVKEKADGGNNE